MGDIYDSLTSLSAECVLLCFEDIEQSAKFLVQEFTLLHFCKLRPEQSDGRLRCELLPRVVTRLGR